MVVKKVLSYILLVLVGLIMTYPFIWMGFACFKSNAEIFGSQQFLPASFSFEAFIKGWVGVGQYTFTDYFINTLQITIPTVFFTLVSCSIVAYGFTRFRFPLKNFYLH